MQKTQCSIFKIATCENFLKIKNKKLKNYASYKNHINNKVLELPFTSLYQILEH